MKKLNIEINSEEEFKHYKAYRDGYFVIIDTTRRVIHTTGCPHVNISNFREKVLKMPAKMVGITLLMILWKVEKCFGLRNVSTVVLSRGC